MSSSVAVYAFKRFDIIDGKSSISSMKGTLDAISKARGEPLMNTKEFVDASVLDSLGFYRTAK